MCRSLDALCEDYKEEGFQLAVKICKELVQCLNITDEELAKKYHCTKEEVAKSRKERWHLTVRLQSLPEIAGGCE